MTLKMLRRILLIVGAVVAGAGFMSDATFAAEATNEAAQGVDYVRDVKPLLVRKCYSCHGALKQSGGLRLDTRSMMLAGGDSGAAVVAKSPQESLLLSAVRGDGDIERMPLESEPLSAAEINLLERWIVAGAVAPDEPLPPDPRQHWSFQPVVRPAIPAPKNAAAKQHPIDALLAVEHGKRGLVPVAAAEPRTLLRRLYLDLIGLPPTSAELNAFVAAAQQGECARLQAYEAAVDKLLASPQYAERWARHWMDVWRYSDWDGYRAEVRESQPHIWRWREWIIESLAADKPYDQMIVEMLAADEIAPNDPQTLRATGFLARNWYKFNRNVWLESTVEHTSKAFLGLTVNCAKCHDHFFDPISQRDYYSFRAFFEPHQVRTDRVPGQANTETDGIVHSYDANATAATYLFARGDEAKPDKEHPIEPHIPRLFAKAEPKIVPVDLPLEAYYPGWQRFVRDEERGQATKAVEVALKAVVSAKDADRDTMVRKLKLATQTLVAIEARLAADEARYGQQHASGDALAKRAATEERTLAQLRASSDVAEAEAALAAAKQKLSAAKEPAEQEKLKKPVTDAEKKLADVQKALAKADENLKKTDGAYASFGGVYPKQSTGRRTALARWIASRENPLTARMAVNQIWMRHLGEPLVSSVFDLGRNGTLPTNQALLDWLASELVDHGWRMKPLHRVIVTSAAYQRSSHEADTAKRNREIDPENVYLWRANTRRMEAEVVRDAILSVAGTLDLARGGADIDPEKAESVLRRSMYFRHAKEKKVDVLDLFDRANVMECYQRSESIVPQQALAISNSLLAQNQARALAKSLLAEQASAAPANEQRLIAAAFERVLNRPPTAAEQSACQAFVAQQSVLLGVPAKLHKFTAGPKAPVAPAADARQRAFENLMLVLLNHNDFVTIR